MSSTEVMIPHWARLDAETFARARVVVQIPCDFCGGPGHLDGHECTRCNRSGLITGSIALTDLFGAWQQRVREAVDAGELERLLKRGNGALAGAALSGGIVTCALHAVEAEGR